MDHETDLARDIFYKHLPPEKEMVLGALTTVIYSYALLQPHQVPDILAQTLDQAESFLGLNLPENAVYASGTIGGSIITVDGTRRFIHDSLYFYLIGLKFGIQDLKNKFRH